MLYRVMEYVVKPVNFENLRQTIARAVELRMREKQIRVRESKGTYGWEEEVPYAPCRHEEEVRCFYQKSGMLAAVSYVLGIGDLHYENIIADEDEPVIIDAETLFQYMNPIYQWDEKAAAFYSVLSSGLFPGGNVGKNVSGIIGGEGELYEREVPMILNDQTSEMRVGYGKPRLKKGKNRVQCGKSIVTT